MLGIQNEEAGVRELWPTLIRLHLASDKDPGALQEDMGQVRRVEEHARHLNPTVIDGNVVDLHSLARGRLPGTRDRPNGSNDVPIARVN